MIKLEKKKKKTTTTDECRIKIISVIIYNQVHIEMLLNEHVLALNALLYGYTVSLNLPHMDICSA